MPKSIMCHYSYRLLNIYSHLFKSSITKANAFKKSSELPPTWILFVLQNIVMKIMKPIAQKPNGQQELLKLEINLDFKAQLWEFNSTTVKGTEFGGGQKAIIIFVPVPQLKSSHNIKVRLVHELEKKFSGKHMVSIAQIILPKPIQKKKKKKSHLKNRQKHPKSCTLTSVYNAILENLGLLKSNCGQEDLMKLDGSQLIKVHLDKAQNNVEPKDKTFSGACKKLTSKDINSEFPEFQM
ncbi:LOW QUALITY PROTEIN: 40S ribosomal protein S7-like [Marmota marmota marmota]|uniref:LOW QUALITY PROTEIN: 40S ribosomal protein S7-like n=1 Tax=Marmota marmota marmota TaxID=9994 RepID=UPI0020926A40|nr:LOW QUALITY PROTEIN: 40S ribosomal protein S7-like [Marmota marmota marmota]